ncbi:hypothetical protein BG000_004864, partial [Podila horticola]
MGLAPSLALLISEYVHPSGATAPVPVSVFLQLGASSAALASPSLESWAHQLSRLAKDESPSRCVPKRPTSSSPVSAIWTETE